MLTSLAELIAVIPSGSRVIVAITGAPGAGKSTLAADLVSALPNAALLSMDGFHLPQARLVDLGRRERVGAPDTFDVDGFLDVLRALRRGSAAVVAPGFDREIEEPIPAAITISPSIRFVVVEGNYLLLDSGGWEAAAALFDVTVFVEVEREVRIAGLIARHIRFGKTADAARSWALGPDEANALAITATAVRAQHRITLR